jgi:hypothetical protein
VRLNESGSGVACTFPLQNHLRADLQNHVGNLLDLAFEVLDAAPQPNELD